MPHYDDVIMSEKVRFSSQTGPTTSTQVIFTGGGQRKTNRRWNQKLRRLNIVYIKPIAEIGDIAETFDVVEGPWASFLIRDWNDWNTRPDKDMRPGAETGVTDTDQPMQNTTTPTSYVGDGSTQDFQCVKRYQKGSAIHNRIIKKPQSLGFLTALDGTPTAGVLDTSTGIVTFTPAPGIGVVPTWGGTFLIPVAFVEDQLPTELRTGETSGLPSIPLIEVRDA